MWSAADAQRRIAVPRRAADRIDWMYSGGMTAKVEADKRNEEAMLGTAPVPQQEADKEVQILLWLPAV